MALTTVDRYEAALRAREREIAGLRRALDGERRLADHRASQLVAAEAERERAVAVALNANSVSVRVEAENQRLRQRHEIPVPDPRVDMTLVVSCPDEDAEHIRLLLGRLADERDRAVEARENANAATLRAEAERARYRGERDAWIRLFNRLEGAVAHWRKGMKDMKGMDFDEALCAAHDRVLKAAATNQKEES